MKLPVLILILASSQLLAGAADESDILALAQKVFAGIAAHDAGMIRSAMLPDARVVSARDDAAPSSISADDLATRIAATKGELIERFTGKPAVEIHGRIAQVWGEYEFLRDGKFSHCGVDTFTLFRTTEGWKIAMISYTTETTGCKGQ